MKVLVPFSKTQDIARMIRFNGDIEIYVGFQDRKWQEAFGNRGMNRMSGHGSTPDLSSFCEVLGIIQEFHEHSIPVFITMNNTNYSQDEIEFICKEYLPGLKTVAIDGIIIGDEKLIRPLKSFGITAVASTMLGIYNQGLVDYYKARGITRQIIPRDVSMIELEQLVERNKDIDFETFLMRNGCRYSDSNCLCTHGVDGGICRRIDRSRHRYISCNKEQFEFSDWSVTDHLYSTFFHVESCGICAIWKLIKLGICSGKIVGRADDPIRVERDVELCIENIRIAERCSSENEYLKRMMPPQQPVYYCRSGYSCYYPEVRY